MSRAVHVVKKRREVAQKGGSSEDDEEWFAEEEEKRTAALAAEPLPWQMGLQPPAGSIAEMADDLHNLLLVVITLISLFVLVKRRC